MTQLQWIPLWGNIPDVRLEHRALQVSAIWKRDKGVCHICKENVLRSTASRDHIIPKSLARDKIWFQSAWNIALAHKLCNSLRGSDLLNKLGEVTLKIGEKIDVEPIQGWNLFITAETKKETNEIIISVHALRS